MEYNMNAMAKVKLTEYGKDVVRQIYPHYLLDMDGYYVSELWNIMNIFGPHFYNGTSKLPFKDNKIIINE